MCEWLQSLGEEEAATSFMEAWGGDNGTWMNGFLLPGCVLHNNALEATWKWLKNTRAVREAAEPQYKSLPRQ